MWTYAHPFWSRMRTVPETDIVDELVGAAARPVAVVEKPIYSLFTTVGTKLLEQHGWTDLVLCGIATESCILKRPVTRSNATSRRGS